MSFFGFAIDGWCCTANEDRRIAQLIHWLDGALKTGGEEGAVWRRVKWTFWPLRPRALQSDLFYCFRK